MINCKLIGFRRELCMVKSKDHIIMEECLVDLTTGQAQRAAVSVVCSVICTDSTLVL
jgi:hypothetical protein